MEDFWGKILAACIQGGCTVAAVYFAAWFAIEKFHREKKWEKQEAAYTELFKAIQSIADFYELKVAEYSGELNIDPMFDPAHAKMCAGHRHICNIIQLGAWDISEESILELRRTNRTVEELGTKEWSGKERAVGYAAVKKTYEDCISTIKAYARNDLRK